MATTGTEVSPLNRRHTCEPERTKSNSDREMRERKREGERQNQSNRWEPVGLLLLPHVLMYIRNIK